MPSNSPIITTSRNAAVPKILPSMARVRMFSSRRFGGLCIRFSRGGSLQSAMAAKVSMMTLIHSS